MQIHLNTPGGDVPPSIVILPQDDAEAGIMEKLFENGVPIAVKIITPKESFRFRNPKYHPSMIDEIEGTKPMHEKG